jgi:predicted short-subunit dehydrogenase-like oxidoreductase (DUF2520 family)
VKPVTIIGAGAVGRSIALDLFYKGVPIAGVYSRSGRTAKGLGKRVNARFAGVLDKTSVLSSLIIIAVPDTEIKNVAAIIGKISISLKDTVIVHTSGAFSSAELQLLHKRGGATGSFHPMQTFPRTKQSRLRGIWIAVEGDTRAVAHCRRMAKLLGTHTFPISKEAKVLYHMTGVFASNYFVTLLSVVEKLAGESGIPPSLIWKIYQPIIGQTLRNVVGSSPASALTGPIARGDTETVIRHLRALSAKKMSHLAALYSSLGIETVRLAKEKRR